MAMTQKDSDDLIFSVSGDKQYLLIEVKRPMTTDLVRRCGEGIAELCQKTKISRFLIDLRGAPSLVNPIHDYNFAHHDMKFLNIPRNHRAALLVDPDDQSHQFIETVMVNTGYDARLFRDKHAAITWLMM
jgi:hypothetical protein